jgi:hypothetical protein
MNATMETRVVQVQLALIRQSGTTVKQIREPRIV